VTTLIGAKNPEPRRSKRTRATAKARLSGWIKSVRFALQDGWRRQEGRWALWPPIAMMGGAAYALVGPQTFSVWPPLAMGLAFTALAWLARYGPGQAASPLRGAAAAGLVFVSAGAFGLAAAELRTDLRASPRLAD
jgi:hypothetical protein